MRAAKLIVNPAADRGRAAAMLPDIRSALRGLGVESDVAQTRAPREAAGLAQCARQDGFELVVAVGGDGTVHEVVNGLVAAAGEGVAGTLGIIPIGAGNDLAYSLNMPAGWREACARIARGKTRRMDVGLCNGEAVTNSIGIGFEAQVNLEARRIRWVQGPLIYFAALARTLAQSYRTPRVMIVADGETTTQAITNITIGNGRRTGSSFLLTPQAELSDGLFDVCIARAMSRVRIVALIPRLMRGTHTGDPLVRMLRARRIAITSDQPLPVHADGELVNTAYHNRIVAELLPQKLEVVV